ncbi:MAG TPA: DUF1570 domain-containing protein [Phycisphaerae bacterium]|nr:DUF1570 domain-containing protein [Phycisphaerae bacterium]HRW55011.1 DUF1570 domain-containing protein [Phycisphaerae bacterium]
MKLGRVETVSRSLNVHIRRISAVAIIGAIGLYVILGTSPTAIAKPKVEMSDVPPDLRDEYVSLRYVSKHIGEGFKVRRSMHYSIIYNTSEEDVAVFEYAIEKTYRACAKWCIGMGLEIHQPKKKLLTHFFNDFREYQAYSVLMGSPVSGPGTAGFYHPMTNYSYFYNFRNTPGFKNAKLNIDQQITQLADMLRRGDVPSDQKRAIRAQIRQLRATQNRINTFGGDTTEEVLQHEVAHQVLFNIGFHNEQAALQFANPRWFAEGMAQLFEPIDEGEGSGFGKVNHDKAQMFHRLVETNRLYPVDGFVSDIRFFFSGDIAGVAYPQSWALAHYLTRTKRDELKAYVDEINKRDGDFESSPELELKTFEHYFGKVDDAWVKRWKKYMERVN